MVPSWTFPARGVIAEEFPGSLQDDSGYEGEAGSLRKRLAYVVNKYRYRNRNHLLSERRRRMKKKKNRLILAALTCL